jgi:hypothetical protein
MAIKQLKEYLIFQKVARLHEYFSCARLLLRKVNAMLSMEAPNRARFSGT